MSVSRIRMALGLAAVGIIVSTLLFSGTAPNRNAGDDRGDAMSATRDSVSVDRPGERENASRDALSPRRRAITPPRAAIASSGSRPTRVAAAPAPAQCDEVCRDDLAQARAATERYWQVSAALADGFVESGGCQATPQGAVGIEYVNLARAADPSVDVEEPEALLYVPEGLGGMGRRLVAVEYSVPVLDESQEPPELFGRRFTGPVAGTIPGLEHYRLRVWLFSEGPQGVFAEAHPAEACDSGGPVAPHSTFIGCQEVGVSLFFPAARVREIAKIPDDFRLEGEDDEGGGTTGVTAAGFSCDRVILEDGTEVSDLRFAEVWANVQAPDWEGVGNLGASRYLLRMIFNDLVFARSLRRGMGVGSDVLGDSPDVARECDSIVGLTGDYAFSSPEFILRATVTEPVPHGRPVFIRIWHEGKHGMGLFHTWVGNVAFGTAVGEVIPTPGTLLAELAGCESGADACDPILTGGAQVTFDPAPYTTTVLQEMWNPRHDGTA